MASAGKKGKKSKGTVISLQSFLSNGNTSVGTTQVAKKLRNIEGEDSDDGNNAMPLIYQLPTAPRANRILDDDSIPHKPPFVSYVTNLPFDVNEDDIYDFFESFHVVSLRLPREDGETGRVRGFGYVEFESRDDLIQALSLPDPCIKNRRIRIELSNESEQQGGRQRGNRRGFDGFGSNVERGTGSWRRENVNSESRNYEDNSSGFYRGRRSFEDDSTPGSWRTGNRPLSMNTSPRRQVASERVSSRSGYDRDDRDTTNSNRDELEQERPKLKLQPRTLPLPELVEKIEKPPEKSNDLDGNKGGGGVSSEKVFGSAKPVDTATRDLEIEERLAEARRQELLRCKNEMDIENVSEKFKEIDLKKTEKENTNSTISWRRRNDDGQSKSPGRKDYPKQVERRQDKRDNREKSRFNRNRDRNDRFEVEKTSISQLRDGKHKDDSKTKRDFKTERPLPKLGCNQIEPVLQSSNKYSGLDDEASD